MDNEKTASSGNSLEEDYEDLVKRFNVLNEKYFALQKENRKLIWENQDLIKKVKLI